MVFNFEQGVLGRIFFSDALEKRSGNAFVLRFFCRYVCGKRGGTDRRSIFLSGVGGILFSGCFAMRFWHICFFRSQRRRRRFFLLMQQQRRIARRCCDDQLLGKTRELPPVL